MHARLRDQRGKASEYPCVDCGQPAHGWSYDHSDDAAERISRRGHRYSTDLHLYAPRCATCHAVFDGVGSRLSVMAKGGAR